MLISKENLPDGFIIPDTQGHCVFAPMKNNNCKNCATDCQFAEDTKNGLIKGGICPEWTADLKLDIFVL